jgi:GMP synthase-like glutamine amidotransferase
VKIGILKTDAVRPEWVPDFGEYPDMFVRLLSAVDPQLEFAVWDVEEGDYPASLDEADAWLITGSKSSVYDDKQWIRDLEAFVCRLHAARRKVIGICFGHQLVAQALGGRVEKSEKGWGVGIHTYRIASPRIGDPQGDGTFRLIVSHQDQVVALPPGAEVTAYNPHCEVAGMRIGDHILTFQGHPEFVPGYSRAIMDFRKEMIGEDRVESGLASLKGSPHQGDLVAHWIVDFLKA